MARKVLTSVKSILKGAKRSHVAAGVSIGKDTRKRKLEIGVDIPSPVEPCRSSDNEATIAHAADEQSYGQNGRSRPIQERLAGGLGEAPR
jgi:hypothetical protein